MFILHVASPYGTIILIGTILFPNSAKEESGLLYSKKSITLCILYNICSKKLRGVVALTEPMGTSGSMVNSLYQEVEMLAVVFHNNEAICRV